MLNHIPQKADNNNIIVKLDSESQKRDITEKVFYKLDESIKEELSNYSIQFKFLLTEEENTENRVYTASDKFNYLVKQNDKLLLMKKNFNLDLE